jgi:hypothetical protein
MAQLPQGGLGAMAPRVPQPPPQQGQPPNPAQAAQRISGLEQEAPEEDFMERALRNKRAQEAALNSQIEALKNSLDSRMRPPFDPALMAAASGFLKPTKTGGFGESAGYAAEAYASETDKDLARKQAVDKAKLELAQKQAAMQSQNLMFEHQMQMSGYDPKDLTTLVTGPSGGSTLAGAPAGGAPTEGAPARVPREPRMITQRDIDIAFAISPEYGKQTLDRAKFQQDDLMSTPQGPISKRSRQAVDVGLDVALEAPVPFLGLQKVTQRILNDVKALEAKYPAGNPNRADAFAQYYAGKGIGGVEYTPGTTGTPATISGMDSAAKKKLAEESSSQIQKSDIEDNAAVKKGIYEAGRGAYGQILAADQLYRLSTDPKTRNAFGVLQQNNIQSAIMGAIADGIQTTTGSIKFAGIEDAVRKVGGTQEEVNAALQAARYYAELELNYARTYLKGQGAVSDNERKIVGKIGGSLSDTAQVAAAKAETVKARANYDKKVSDLYYQWEKKNPGKMVKDFERNPRYEELQTQFDEYMGKLADKYFPGTPSKPSTTPSATPPAATPPASAPPAAPRPQTKPPANAPAAPPVVTGDDDPAYKNLKPGQQYIYNGQVKTKNKD